MTAPARRAAAGSRPPATRAPIQRRLSAAGLPPLARTAWLEVDLDALAANVRLLRGLVPAGVRLEPVVKADAYGHGLVPVAAALAANGVDGLCVATLDEGLALRDAELRLPILVLYPVPAELVPEAARRSIAVTIGDRTLAERTLAEVQRWRRGPGRRPPLRVQLEIETGLGRGGLAPAEAPAVARRLDAEPGVLLLGAWSHLQAPGEPAVADRQLEALLAAQGLIEAAGVRLGVRHLVATGGLVAGRLPALDAIRPGLVVYGVVPDDLAEHVAGTPFDPDGPGGPGERLAPVASLHARPVRVAELPAGTGVSYGPSFTTGRPSRIATLPLGYADGWSRALSNRAQALVRGHRVPLVGTVAMDAVMADVTDVPGPPVTVDDEFTLIGRQGAERITAADVARWRNTISWEVLSAMSARLDRVYTAAAEPAGVRFRAGGRGEWRTSSSGTATSATSRSTRS